MRCVICKHGDTKSSTTPVVLDRNDTTIAFKKVPCKMCKNCGESYASDAAAARLLRSAEAIARKGAQVEIRAYASV